MNTTGPKYVIEYYSGFDQCALGKCWRLYYPNGRDKAEFDNEASARMLLDHLRRANEHREDERQRIPGHENENSEPTRYRLAKVTVEVLEEDADVDRKAA